MRLLGLTLLMAVGAASPSPAPSVQFFRTLGEEGVELPPVPVERVKVFRGRPWINWKCPGTLMFSVKDGRDPMPAEWVDRLRKEAAGRGCNGIQIGFQQGGVCDYFEAPQRIDGYCARCLVMPRK